MLFTVVVTMPGSALAATSGGGQTGTIIIWLYRSCRSCLFRHDAVRDGAVDALSRKKAGWHLEQPAFGDGAGLYHGMGSTGPVICQRFRCCSDTPRDEQCVVCRRRPLAQDYNNSTSFFIPVLGDRAGAGAGSQHCWPEYREVAEQPARLSVPGFSSSTVRALALMAWWKFDPVQSLHLH